MDDYDIETTMVTWATHVGHLHIQMCYGQLTVAGLNMGPLVILKVSFRVFQSHGWWFFIFSYILNI